MKSKIFLAAALIISSTLHAQQDSTSVLNEVVVTATKFPLKQSLTGKVLTVISAKEIEANTGRSLSDVLNMQTGLIINGATGVKGTNQDIYMRGAAAGKTLVLIDGVPLYDVSGISGSFDINFIPLETIERIEILKGSQSTLYGSDAVAGVINIILKKGGIKKLGANLLAAAGTYGTVKTNAGINGTVNKTSYNLQYGFENSQGFSTANDKKGTGNFDKDGFDRRDAKLYIGQQLTKTLLLGVHAGYDYYKSDLDAGAFKDDADYTVKNKNTQAGLDLKFNLKKNSFYFKYDYNKTERGYLDDSASRGGFSYFSTGNYKGRSHFAELYANFLSTKKTDLLAGIDFRQQETDQDYFSISSYGPYGSNLSGDSSKVTQTGVYASVILKDISGFNFELGGRYNNFNKYGDVFTWSINPSYSVNDKIKLFANVSSGFKAPSLYQVYSEYRNPTTELKPEKSLSADGGISYEKKNVMLRAVYFSRNIKDNIVFYSGGAPNFESYYINADKQKVLGLETEAKFTVDNFSISINYTNLDGKIETTNKGKDTSYFNLYRRPNQTINLQAGIAVTNKFSLLLNTQSISLRKEAVYGAAPVELPAYSTWNLNARYQFLPSVSIFADLKNITNTHYQEVLGYNTMGFNVLAGIKLSY